MRYLTLGEVIALHRAIVASTRGGADGLRDLGALESAIAQPKATFDSVDLYPSLVEKAQRARPWPRDGIILLLDGNKRIAFMPRWRPFLDLNGWSSSRPRLTSKSD